MCKRETPDPNPQGDEVEVGRRNFLTASLAGAPLLLQAGTLAFGQTKSQKGAVTASAPKDMISNSAMTAPF